MEVSSKKRGRPGKIIPQELVPTAVLTEAVNNTLTVEEDKKIDRVSSVDRSVNNNIDKVANVEQKERAMAEAGVTRVRVYKKINELLNAVKVVEELKDGQVVLTEVPDVTANAKGAELALKAFNDLKEFQAAVGTTHNKVVYQWLNVNTVAPVKRIGDE